MTLSQHRPDRNPAVQQCPAASTICEIRRPQPTPSAVAAQRLARKHNVRPRASVSASAGLCLAKKYKLGGVPRMTRAAAVLLLCCIASPAVFAQSSDPDQLSDKERLGWRLYELQHLPYQAEPRAGPVRTCAVARVAQRPA